MSGVERRQVLEAAAEIRRHFAKASGKRERAALRIAKQLEELAK